jgi:phytoene dehydrogenase-like protein
LSGAGGRGGYDAIVVGGGHNGLVCGAYLAKAGLRTLILERRERIGGAADTTEVARGVRVPTLAHTVGRLRGSVARDLDLIGHGLSLIQPAARVFAPGLDGASVTLWRDPARTAAELADVSAHDAAAYPAFDARMRAVARIVNGISRRTPPDLASASLADALGGVKLGVRLRTLDRAALAAAMRLLPMPVADLVTDAFETDALRAAIAHRGVMYSSMSPASPGTTALLLAEIAGSDGGVAGQAVFARGGPGALSAALADAARAVGAEIRTGTDVVAVRDRDERVAGVALATGEEIDATIVASGIDPRRTFLKLLDPATLGPRLAWRAGNIRIGGTIAKVNLALAAMPRFSAVAPLEDGIRRLRGRISLAPGLDALERAQEAAKYGEISEAPVLEVTVPSLVDPTLVDEERAPGAQAMSVIVQYAPYRLRDGDWDTERERLGDRVLQVLEAYAPGITALVTARQVLTPLDLERDYGLTEGHPMHGEPALDQWFGWRPLHGVGRYRTPLDGLFLCGSGSHPGGGITGGPGQNAAREILADIRAR